MLYLDASVLVALLTQDALSDQADALMQRQSARLVVSDFAAVEFASAVARRVRIGALPEQDARSAFGAFDAWTARLAERVDLATSDIVSAGAMLRRLDTPLRSGEALNIAIADRLGAVLATFDRKMAKAARALGVEVAETAG